MTRHLLMLHLAGIAVVGLLLGLGTAAAAESMVERLLRVAGLTAAPAQMRGPGDEVEAGEIWVAGTGAGRAAAVIARRSSPRPTAASSRSRARPWCAFPPAAVPRRRCSAHRAS